MIKYCGSLDKNIFTNITSRFINIATVRPYTQKIKNSKNCGLPCKHIYFEKIFNILFSILILTNDEYNYNVGTAQIIRIMPSNHLSYLCFFQSFIYRLMMSDYFVSEPMDIEGEAAYAVGPQLVTAEGEPGVGVVVKRSFSVMAGAQSPQSSSSRRG